MNKKIIKLALLVLSVLLVMSCIGCADTKEATEKEMIIGAPVATSLDPAIEWQGWTTVRYGVGETLFALDDKMNPKPWIAKSYKLVDDNTWKITLKKGVVFSNGNKLTPEIVIANLKRVGEVNNRASVFKTAEYKVEDDLNFTIKTAEPYATLINDLCDPYAVIVDLDATEDINLKPICTGPFVASETVKEQYYVVVRNDNYWDGKPMLSKVTFKAVGDENTLSMALQSGEIDAAHNITATTASELFGGKADYNVNIIPTSRVYMTYYNLKTMDQPLREAVTAYGSQRSLINVA
jgi:peptide/nickel transport system substrate-binding protein